MKTFHGDMLLSSLIRGVACRPWGAALVGFGVAVAGAAMAIVPSQAQAASPDSPGLTGVWVMPPQRGPRADSRLRLPAAPAPRLNAKYRAAYEASEKDRKEASNRGEPLASNRTRCLPDGMPKMMATTFPLEILETPGKIALIAEFDTQVRHIRLGNATHPAADELEYGFFGHSIGRWEGDTLVVDTIGLRDSTVMFDYVPHSESLQVIERFRLLEPDLLQVTITMVDPPVLAEPWTVIRLFARMTGGELGEYVCTENNRHWGNDQGIIETELRETELRETELRGGQK